MNIHSFLDHINWNPFTHVLEGWSLANTVPSSTQYWILTPAGKISYDNANNVIGFVKSQGDSWLIIETHAHAEHLSSAPYIKARN